MVTRNIVESGQIRRELDALKSDLGHVRRDMSEVVSSVMEMSRRGGGELSGQMRQRAHQRMNQLNDAYGRARDTGARSARIAGRKASEHPVWTTVAALAIGGLIAAIIGGIRYRKH